MSHLIAGLNLLLLGMFPLHNQAHDSLNLRNLNNRIPFCCSLRFIEPWCDHAAKKSYCIFHPYSPAQLLPAKLNYKEGFLHILVHANLKEDPKVTGSVHALFVKGFYIKEQPKVVLCPSLYFISEIVDSFDFH